MSRFNRLGVITGIAALVFAVLGLAIAVVEPAKAAPEEKCTDCNGLTISHLGI